MIPAINIPGQNYTFKKEETGVFNSDAPMNLPTEEELQKLEESMKKSNLELYKEIYLHSTIIELYLP